MFFKKRKASKANGPSGRPSRPALSIIGPDVVVHGNISTEGELQIEGTIQGDVRATSIVIGPQGTVHGEVSGDEIAVQGRVIGPIRGLRVQVFSGAHVDGDIVHDSLAVETGAFCQGNIRRSDAPLAQHEPPHPRLHDAELPPVDPEEELRRPQRRPIMLRSRAAE